MTIREAQIHDLPELRELTGVFEDRIEAGKVLAKMLEKWRESNAIIWPFLPVECR